MPPLPTNTGDATTIAEAHRLHEASCFTAGASCSAAELIRSAQKSSCPRPAGARKRVVIVGASFSGLQACRKLSKDFDVTVIDAKEYFEYTPGILRLFVDPAHMPAITASIPHKHNKLVIGEVVTIGVANVIVKDHRLAVQNKPALSAVYYDYLLVGCGASYQWPIRPAVHEDTIEKRRKTWEDSAEKLRRADSILIIGGGPVGVELAAEICVYHPKKTITIVDGAPALMSAGFPAKASEHAASWLRGKGVQLRLGEWIEEVGETGCRLKGGEELQADVVYKCTGAKPNTALLAQNFGDHLDPKSGSLLVNDHLQVEGHPRIFGMGDCMLHRSREAKLGYTAELNAQLVADNVCRHDAGRPLLSYPEGAVHSKVSPRIYCVSLGRFNGSLVFNSLVVNGALAAAMKVLIEHTKMRAMREEMIGGAFWEVADHISALISKFVIT